MVPILESFATALVFAMLSGLLFRNIHRAAIWSSANLIYFFTYGGVFRMVRYTVPGSHKILLAVGIVMNIVILYFLWKRKPDMAAWSPRLNGAALILFALPFVSIIRFEIQAGFEADVPRQTVNPLGLVKGARSDSLKNRPDIYHIMMDAYSRDDVLKTAYHFDNQPFLQGLRGRGFQIGRGGSSNYSATDLSMTSALNMNYLDSLDVQLQGEHQAWKKLESLRNDSRVVQFLKSFGYRWIVVPHGWENSLPEKADAIHMPPEDGDAIYLSEFENGFLAMTPVRYLLSALGMNGLRKRTQHANRILFEFDYLMDCANEKGPKYVFVHILAPHTPVVFGPEGDLKLDIPDMNHLRIADPSRFRLAATGEIAYLNKRLLRIVDKIIKDSKGNAVILLHSDHGESVLEFSDDPEFLVQRHGVLAALYLPGGAKDTRFYPRISNVNFFRFIFNHLFDSGFPMLPDRTWYSSTSAPFLFREITGVLDSAAAARGIPE
ncbi:MAG: sulfatase-like hydrolase/transferase [Fibrobacteria bacterium]